MRLKNKKVVVLAESGYEDLELHYPRLRLEEAGAEVIVASPDGKKKDSANGYPSLVDEKIANLNYADFDAVLIPGGRECPDLLRDKDEVLEFIRHMDEESGKVIGAICHAGWVLISAGIIDGRDMTCYHTIKDDIENAGANYIDDEVVVDGNLVTSRFPPDLPAYCREIIKLLE